ncbi:hypothetical protein OSB04_012250 [Centaurea solstitialis]|uniref:Transcription factor IIIC putative zinc-finger domain-containing protein n=1 Tax=Centaurea solstitialis TaxID=347529 RepID=A0AA38TLQ0_9ASTR|nr:hypothetical protein OSB04_012250 [Centaurea solstitialis]
MLTNWSYRGIPTYQQLSMLGDLSPYLEDGPLEDLRANPSQPEEVDAGASIYVAEEDQCSYCSAPVPFKDTEVAFCEADKCKLPRCAVSMAVCSSSPSWVCVSCNRSVSNLAPESLFTLHRYLMCVDSEQEGSMSLQKAEVVLSKLLCPFCGVLLQKRQPLYLLPTSPV